MNKYRLRDTLLWKVVLSILFGSFTFLTAQDDFIIQLKEIETNEPISYATVRFSGTNRGLVADYYGQFRLPVDFTSNISELLITSIGFTSLRISTSSLKTDTLNTFFMKPQVEMLDAVILKQNKPRLNPDIKKRQKLLALDIVSRAVSFIRVNLSDKPHSYIGYYRDYQTVGNGNYYNLNEGILEQFDGGIFSNKITSEKNQGAFYQFKPNLNFPRDSLLSAAYDDYNKFLQGADILNYGGNELSILNVHNPIRLFDANSFSFIYRIQYEFLDNHLFSKGNTFYNDGDPIITINIEGRDEKIPPTHRVVGYIKISLSDFAIHELKYTVYERNRSNPLFNVEIQYRKIKDKMYLNYMTFNNRFVIRDADVFKEDYITYDKDYNLFKIRFIRDADIKTIKKRNFKIYYNNRRIRIDKIIIDDASTVKLILPRYEQELQNLRKKDTSSLRITMKNIKDRNGKEIYKEYNRSAYQFREFFVQEVFERKALNMDLNYIDKLKPLPNALINQSVTTQRYIINSPLKNISL